MVVIKSCFLSFGIFPTYATAEDLGPNSVHIDDMYSTCGFLGLFPQKATLDDIENTCFQDGGFGFATYSKIYGRCTMTSCNVDRSYPCEDDMQKVCEPTGKAYPNECKANRQCAFNVSVDNCKSVENISTTSSQYADHFSLD